MTTTVHLTAAGPADQPLAEALARAMPRLGRRGAVRVTRVGDPAAADWFLLLASPEAAVDPAVDEAIRRWLATSGVERLLIVVTAGTWEWDAREGALSARSTAVPESLRRAFPVEPRHMVYPGARGARPSVRDPLFLEQVAEITAPIVGTTKDDLAGEDVRRQRRTRRLTRAGAGVLAALLLVAATGGVVAQQSAAAADQARQDAEQARNDADSRRLALLSQQVAGTDGALERLLAVEAWRIAETAEAAAALERAGMVADGWDPTPTTEDVRRLIGHQGHPMDLALSNSHAATVDTSSRLRIWDLHDLSSPVELPGFFGGLAGGLAWSHDGATLAVAGGRVHRFDVAGEDLGFAGPRAPASVAGPWGPSGFVAGGDSIALIADRQVVAERPTAELGFTDRTVFVSGSADGQLVLAASEAGQVALLDAELATVAQWQFTVAVDQFGERDSMRLLAWDGADRVVLPPDNATILGPILVDGEPDSQDNAIAGIYEVRTGAPVEPIRAEILDPLPATSAVFLPDGSAIALTPGGRESPPALGRTDAAADLSDLPLPAGAEIVRISPDGTWLATAGVGSAEAHLSRIARGEGEQRDGGSATEGSTDSGSASDSGEGADNPDTGESGEDADTPDPGETADSGEGADTPDPGDPADAGDPLTRACAAAGRNLTVAEWAIYLPDREYRATCEGFDIDDGGGAS